MVASYPSSARSPLNTLGALTSPHDAVPSNTPLIRIFIPTKMNSSPAPRDIIPVPVIMPPDQCRRRSGYTIPARIAGRIEFRTSPRWPIPSLKNYYVDPFAGNLIDDPDGPAFSADMCQEQNIGDHIALRVTWPGYEWIWYEEKVRLHHLDTGKPQTRGEFANIIANIYRCYFNSLRAQKFLSGAEGLTGWQHIALHGGQKGWGPMEQLKLVALIRYEGHDFWQAEVEYHEPQ